jgi:hypothetical protein
MEGILREFAGFKPKRFFFRHPVHVPDTSGVLNDSVAVGELDTYGKAKKDPTEIKPQEEPKHSDAEICEGIEYIRDEDGIARLKDFEEFIGVSRPTARKYVKRAGKFLDDGIITSNDRKRTRD